MDTYFVKRGDRFEIDVEQALEADRAWRSRLRAYAPALRDDETGVGRYRRVLVDPQIGCVFPFVWRSYDA